VRLEVIMRALVPDITSINCACASSSLFRLYTG